MTTRWHWENVAPAISPSFDASWFSTATAVRMRQGAGNGVAVTVSETSAVPVSLLAVQVVTDALAAGVVEGTFRLAVMTSNAQSSNAFLRVIVRVVDSAGTVRGVLVDATDATALPTGSTQTVTAFSAAMTPVTAVAGDRIVVAYGAYMNNTATTSRSINFGTWSSGNSDHAFTDGATASGKPWFEIEPPPDAPTALTQTAATTTTVDVSWTAPTGGTTPTGYDLRVDGGAPTALGLVTTRHITGLTPDTDYTVEVRATAASGNSAWVSVLASTDPLPPPGPPTGLTQTAATPTSVTVDWTAPASGTTPTSYEVRVNGGTPVDVGNVTSTTISSLTAGTTYTVEVRTVATGSGASSWVSVSASTTPPPNPPTGLAQTAATPTSVTVEWTAPASGETPTSYEYRVDGGTPVDVGNVLVALIDTLTPATTYTVEVRTLADSGSSSWASVDATTDSVTPDGLALEAGPDFDTQLLDDTYSITVRRAVRSNGVTDDLEPATFTAVIKGSDAVNPLTNDDVRPERPIRLRATLDGGATWETLWTGKIQRARIEYDPDEKDDTDAYRLILTGTDVVASLAGVPSEVAIDGNLHQRVGAVLDPTGIAYDVDDPSSVGVGDPLPTDAKDVLGQLRLIRDTAHALMYVDRDGALVVVADNARPRTIVTPDWTATDDVATDAIHYTEIDPAFDTDAVVNVLAVTTLDGASNPVAIFTDDTSRDSWGDKAQAITVNDGVAETHADLYLASRVDPDLIPEHIDFVVQERLPQAIAPAARSSHLAAAVGIELYDVVRVERDGMPTTDLLIREITHTISHRAWRVGLGLRVPEVLATRWDDVPVGLTWDDVPPGMTWREAVNWHPYL